MSSKRLPLNGEYKELIKVIDVDEINNETHFNAMIPFSYDIIEYKKDYRNPITGLVTTSNTVLIKTYEDIPVKTGDIIRIYDKEEYQVRGVVYDIEDNAKRLVQKYPGNLSRYRFKKIIME